MTLCNHKKKQKGEEVLVSLMLIEVVVEEDHQADKKFLPIENLIGKYLDNNDMYLFLNKRIKINQLFGIRIIQHVFDDFFLRIEWFQLI